MSAKQEEKRQEDNEDEPENKPKIKLSEDTIRIADIAADLYLDAEQSDSLRDYYVKLGKALEADKVPKHLIAKTARDVIEKRIQERAKKRNPNIEPSAIKFRSGWFYAVCAEHGWTDPSFDHRSKDDPGQERRNSSEILTISPSKPFADERNFLIALCLAGVKAFQNQIEELRTETDEVIHEDGSKTVEKRNWNIFFADTEAFSEFMQFIGDLFFNEYVSWDRHYDRRNTLHPRMRFTSAAIIGLTSNKYFCDNFLDVKPVYRITTKAITKFQEDVRSMSDLLKMARQEAWKWNVLEIKCPDCKEYTLQDVMYATGERAGTWDFVCINSEAHRHDAKVDNKRAGVWLEVVNEANGQVRKHFPPTLFKQRLEVLDRNWMAAKKHCDDRGIHVKGN